MSDQVMKKEYHLMSTAAGWEEGCLESIFATVSFFFFPFLFFTNIKWKCWEIVIDKYAVIWLGKKTLAGY